MPKRSPTWTDCSALACSNTPAAISNRQPASSALPGKRSAGRSDLGRHITHSVEAEEDRDSAG